MKKSSVLSRAGLAAASILGAILAGILLMTAVYALPTARMRHNVEISLP